MHKFLINFNYICFLNIFYNITKHEKIIFHNIFFFLYTFPKPNTTTYLKHQIFKDTLKSSLKKVVIFFPLKF